MRNVESRNPTLDFLQQKLKVEPGSVSSKDTPEILMHSQAWEPLLGPPGKGKKAFHVKSLDRLLPKGRSMKRTTTQDFLKDGADVKS